MMKGNRNCATFFKTQLEEMDPGEMDEQLVKKRPVWKRYNKVRGDIIIFVLLDCKTSVANLPNQTVMHPVLLPICFSIYSDIYFFASAYFFHAPIFEHICNRE